MNFSSNTPIYLQVIDAIKKDLVLGNIKPGDKLPSTRDMALTFSINPNTAARIYKEMELMELSFTKRGLGTFVTEDLDRISHIKEEMATSYIENFIQEMTTLGYSIPDLVKIIEMRRSNNDTETTN